jgi:DNA-directed RNA polymerase specialized sigma24 family protein
MTGHHDDEFAVLHEAWRRGEATATGLFAALRDPMRRAARRSLRAGLAEKPNEADVDWAVQRAFENLLEKEPDEVKISLRGFAATIAHFRGMDRARWLVRQRERIKQTNWQLEVVTPTIVDEDAFERRERLFEHLLECKKSLSHDQRDLIENVVQQQVSLSDWTAERGTSYEAGRRMRFRALEILRSCVEAKLVVDREEEFRE